MLYPGMTIVLLLMMYNQITIGRPVITDLGFLNDIGSSITYIDENVTYPPSVNIAIHSINKSFPSDQRNVLDNSWDFKRFVKNIFKMGYLF